MKLVRKRLTYANVMSSIAVFLVVAGGTAFAATQMLPKNSVGAKQIKKGAVGPAKLSPAAKVTLTGPAGPKGATGATGTQGLKGDKGEKGDRGEKGERGPSNAVSNSVEGNVQIGVNEGAALEVTSVSLSAGNWVVVGETGLTNVSGASRSAWCSLNSGTEQLGLTRALDEAEAGQRSGDATVLGSVSLGSAGTVALRCWATGTGVYTPSQSKPAIQAIQVGSLN